MPIRESGMPKLEHWESLFDPAALLDALGFSNPLGDVVDFGCGYGTFALALAERTSGTVYAIDGDPAMLRLTQKRARDAALRNVVPIEGDLLADGASLASASVDAVLIAHRDVETPRGPPLEMRPTLDQFSAWAQEAGFSNKGIEHRILGEHHWGIRGRPC